MPPQWGGFPWLRLEYPVREARDERGEARDLRPRDAVARVSNKRSAARVVVMMVHSKPPMSPHGGGRFSN